jgi:hypothetical protein
VPNNENVLLLKAQLAVNLRYLIFPLDQEFQVPSPDSIELLVLISGYIYINIHIYTYKNVKEIL